MFTRDELELFKKEEFLRAKRWEQNDDIFNFITSIYQRLYTYVVEIEKHYLPLAIAQSQRPYLAEFKQVCVYYRAFSHTHTGRFSAEQLRGSVGAASPQFFKNLPKKSPFYFHVVMTAISNAVFQYELFKGIYGLCRMDLGIDYAGTDHICKIRDPYRQQLDASADTISTLNLPYEELQGRFKPNQRMAASASGEQRFALGPDCTYVQQAARIGAPTLTGPSSNSYIIFKCLAVLLHLNSNELNRLRMCLTIYMLAAHNHTLIEVIEPIEMALMDLSEKQAVEVRRLSLQNHDDYLTALE